MVSLSFFAKVQILTIYGKLSNKFSNAFDHFVGKLNFCFCEKK
jgi:hypothetical protein